MFLSADNGYQLWEIDMRFGNRNMRRAARFSEYKSNIQPAFQICFGASEIFRNEPVVLKLALLVERVEEVIKLLVSEYIDTQRIKGAKLE